MRYLIALLIACASTFVLFWVGARVATMVSGPERGANDFTVGQQRLICGYQIDTRYALAGYDLDAWDESRCAFLGKLDRCVLGCLEQAGTVEIASACYEDCVRDPSRARAR